MKQIFAICIQAALLFLWGTVALGFVLTGKISSYLHPFFHLCVASGGFLCLALGACLLFLSLTPLKIHIKYHIQNFNRTRHFSLLHLLVLSLPLVCLVFLSQGQFSESFFHLRGVRTSILDLPISNGPLSFSDNSKTEPIQKSIESFPKNESGLWLVTPLDIIYATRIEEIKEQLFDKDVEILGQFLPSNPQTDAAGEFLIVRMFITCCAADAVPLAVVCRTQNALNFPKLSWIRASGKILFPEENGEIKPILLVTNVEAAEAPTENFIY